MVTIYVLGTFEGTKSFRSVEYDLSPIREAIPAILRRVGLNPTLKITLNCFAKTFALPHEIFDEWRSGSDTVYLEQVRASVTMIVKSISYTVLREELAHCSTGSDLWEFSINKGWLTRGEIVRAISIDGWNPRETRIFHPEYNNRVAICTEALRPTPPSRPIPRINGTVSQLAPQDSTCVICQEELFRENCKELSRIDKCGHHFHTTCISEWITTLTTCPLCRVEI